MRHNSYPIEVAWSDADGRIESWLIDPSRIPAWTDWDDRVEEELHGLSRDALRLLGRSPSWVARRLNDASTGQTLYCDGGPFDRYWLYRLFQAAGVRPAFALEDAGDLFERYLAPESLTALAQKARSLVGLRHRAAPDVHYQQVLWWLILTESEEMHQAAKKRVSDGGTASEASSHGVGLRMADDAHRRGDLVFGCCPGEASTPMNLRTAMKRPNIPHHWWPPRQIGPGGLSSPVGPLSIPAFLERLSSVSSLLTTNRMCLAMEKMNTSNSTIRVDAKEQSRTIEGFFLGLLGVLLAGCSQPVASPEPAAPPSPAVSVAEVVVREVAEWDKFTGHIEAVEMVEIRPRVAGYIERFNFQEGQEVKKGDLLFVIDQRPFKAEVMRAEADLARVRARLQLARAQVMRAKKLVEKRVISEDEFDERVAADAQAKADIRAAEAAVAVATLNLEFTEVRSPIDGRAGRALIRPGNLVSGGEMIPDATLLTTVVSLDPVYVYFEGDEQTYLRYGAMARSGERPSSREVANPVFVGLANEEGFPHEGRMNFVDNQLDPTTGTIRARAVLDNKNRRFTPGLFARVKLVGRGKFSAVLVDDKAVLTDQDRSYVYVLGPGNTAQRRDIKLGRMVEGLRVVTEGLAAGDTIIVHGVQKVFFPGMPVNAQTIGMGDPPPPGPTQEAEGGKQKKAASMAQEPSA